MRGVVVILSLVLVGGCGQAGRPPAGPDPTGVGASLSAELSPGRWSGLPDVPLSPRENPAAAHVAGRVVVVGGFAGMPCPPNADCERDPSAVRRDGAALDLETRTWRSIADAPRPVPELAPTAVVGSDLYVLAQDALLVWRGTDDAWDTVPVPGPASWSALVADGSRLVVASGTDEYGVRPDRVLDTTTGDWSTLPPNPLAPSFDRTVTATPEGLVLTAKPIGQEGSPADPARVRAALLPRSDEQWRVLPDSDQLSGWRWSWTGRRLVEPTLGGADGGQTNNYGRTIPYGGRLDPATGTWSRLPGAPEQGTGGWPVEAPGGPVVAAEGWVYDDAGGAWTRLPRPAGAPATPGRGVWAEDVLVVVGGTGWHGVDEPDEWTPEGVWSTGTWAYRAP